MITLVPRIETATRRPALFMRADGEITCYTPAEGHNPASLDYYRQCTAALDPTDPRAVRLVAFWASLPGDVAYRVRQRLARQS